MSEYQITSFRPEHLVPAIQLFIANYEKERNKVPALASSAEIVERIQPRLAELTAKFPACVAIGNNNTVCGYMAGISGLKNFRGPHDGVYILEWAHASGGTDRINVYALMYEYLAESWVTAGNHVQAISILAHDGELQDYWFRQGFGMEVIDAVLCSKPSRGPEIPGLEIIPAHRPKDVAAWIQMRHELQQSLSAAPVLLSILKAPDVESVMDDPRQQILMAYCHGYPAGYMMARMDADGVAAIIGGPTTFSINGVYLRPQFRNRGIAAALLRRIVEWGEQQGVPRIGVDFESANRPVCRFWQKHFSPVCHSCVRHVDARRVSQEDPNVPPPEEIKEIAGRACRWAEQRLGQTGYRGQCLAFVEDALEQANQLELFGGDTAAESADIYEAGNINAPPPEGSLVFYDWEGLLNGELRNWGHVGLSLADGNVIHAWDKVRIDAFSNIVNLSVPPGSGPLRYRGWVPLQRVLLGMQRR